MRARRAAFGVLAGLERSPRRLETLLEKEIPASLAAPERARAVNLIYAVLRNRLYLDHLLATVVERPLAKLDRPVLTVLRLGAAELALLATPDHAAVHAAVELAKATPARRGQGLVNGALRRLARQRQEIPLPGKAGETERLSVAYSHPPWLVEMLLARLGPEETESWLKVNQTQPPLALRVNTIKTGKEELRALLAPACRAAEDHPLSPETLIIREPSVPAQWLPGFDQGLWQAQDPGASALSRLLAVEPGMRVLDMCAGAGGKTGHLAALMANEGELVALEIKPGRVRALKKNLARLGADCARVHERDATGDLDDLGLFDRVLVDAPCTSLGTAGRRPDVRWRKAAGDPARLAGLQLALARSAARRLKIGGAMVYATCTVTEAENQGVMRRLLAAEICLRPAWNLAESPRLARLIGQDGFFRTMPHLHGTDAFFAARLVRDAAMA